MGDGLIKIKASCVPEAFTVWYVKPFIWYFLFITFSSSRTMILFKIFLKLSLLKYYFLSSISFLQHISNHSRPVSANDNSEPQTRPHPLWFAAERA